MDVWSDWTVIGKTIAALEWWWVAVVGAAVVTGAIGVWSWLTERMPRTRVSAQRRQRRTTSPGDSGETEGTHHAREDATPGEVTHDTFRSAA